MLPTDASERKDIPLARGLLDYFPDALVEVARLSLVANEQHNPGEPLHWAKEKSTDEADALMRHLIERGTIDTDGIRHSAKVAWRGLALLQREIEAERERVFVTSDGRRHHCGPYCEHPGQNGVHEVSLADTLHDAHIIGDGGDGCDH